MNFGVHGRQFSPDRIEIIKQFFHELEAMNSKVWISREFYNVLEESKLPIRNERIYDPGDDLSEVEFVISLGGDGTLLETITHVGSQQIPVMGINTGRLGYLASTAKEKVKEAMKSLFNSHYKVEDRALLSLESDGRLFGNLNFALNEFTILKTDTSSMIVVKTFIDGDYLNSYWADGLIVATPTGSTGYSLSCGGPIVLPQSNNFVITPVSPHNLNVRPLIVSDKSVISFEIEGRGKNFLVSLDSRSEIVDASVQLAIRKEDFCAKLVHLNDYNYLDTLRNKLNWGLDRRN